MKLLIFLSVLLKNGFGPSEWAASQEQIVDLYAFEMYKRTNGKEGHIGLSIGELARHITSKYENRKLKMYLMLPVNDSVLIDEKYIGYYSLSGKFKIEV